jgi:hypothetical protein
MESAVSKSEYSVRPRARKYEPEGSSEAVSLHTERIMTHQELSILALYGFNCEMELYVLWNN